MVKKLTKKFKNIKVEITFAEPQEYDIRREGDMEGRDALRKIKSKKKQTTRRAKRTKKTDE